MTETMIPSPSGTTRFLAVVGDPVAQVKAPALLNRLFAEEGIDMVMIPVQAHAENLDVVIRGLQAIENFHGMLVTIPHKFSCCSFAQRHSLCVQLSGSTNALRRDVDGVWMAENFDGIGFVLGLQRAGFEPEGKDVLLLGGGGAGSAIAVALLEAGVNRLYLRELDDQKADGLIHRLELHWPGRARRDLDESVTEVAIVINATPMGLQPEDPLPIDPARFSAGTWVADIIMKPAETRLLKAAAERGLPTQPGIHMLNEQIDCYRRFFSL
ncbi:shikimate dehydrogenase family protein [Pseudomonas sp. CR3202]|uniref:shikimate dehydrogenase family protein n=1 Tax=Pseudomonas sp. CR3202 TaxID=3351532 RepID=UPI003BF2033F